MFETSLRRPAAFVNWLRRSQYYWALAGILIYNYWLVGIVLNWPATRAGATTSELSAAGQPHAYLFRLGDIVAGLALLLGANQLAALGSTRRQQLFLKFAMSVFAISTVVDALLPLDCSAALSQACARREHLGHVSWQHLLHLAESPIAYILIFLIPVVVIRSYWRVRPRPTIWLASWLLLAVIALWMIATLVRLALGSDSFGYEQRIFTVLFTAWFIVAIRAAKTATSKS
ncbi:MAG TPA: DUF998 domain-containing protein [Candidatus Saccharimonadales bacterium]|nr:DUF998 domain-containing protein [Candidatus Saccharimonadales bacterium]